VIDAGSSPLSHNRSGPSADCTHGNDVRLLQGIRRRIDAKAA
jgi:hypothetical protein